jgi:hypothetical protein
MLMRRHRFNILIGENIPDQPYPAIMDLYFIAGKRERWYVTGPKALHLAYFNPICPPKPNMDAKDLLK